MVQALFRAVGQLSDPKFRALVWRALLISIVVFLGLWGLSWWGLDAGGTALANSWLQEGFWNDTIEWLVALGGLAAVLIASFLLFPAVMGLVLGEFLADAAERVEARHYRDLPAAREQPLIEGLRDGLALAGTTVLLNILALPLYLLLSIVPPLNVFVFYALNGYLLGREYFEIVAVRRLTRDRVKQLRARHRGRLTGAGVLIALMLTIPILNLLAPVVATAFMVHVFESLRRRAGLPATRDAATAP
jgi:uncharacterized protein involved in cysteine biosynthesis